MYVENHTTQRVSFKKHASTRVLPNSQHSGREIDFLP